MHRKWTSAVDKRHLGSMLAQCLLADLVKALTSVYKGQRKGQTRVETCSKSDAGQTHSRLKLVLPWHTPASSRAERSGVMYFSKFDGP